MSWLTNLFGHSIAHVVDSVVYQVLTFLSRALASLAGALLGHILSTSNSAAQVSGASFTTLYQAMFLPAMVCAVIVLIVGVISSGIRGNTREIVKRAVLAPVIVTVAVGMAAGIANDALRLVGWVDSTYLTAVFGHAGFASGIGALGPASSSALFSNLPATEVTSIAMDLFNMVIFFFIMLASLAVWAEMQIRVLIVWLMVVLIPLGAAMLFWRGTERLFKRVVELLIAAILLPFPVTVVLAVGVKMGGLTGSISKLFVTLVTVGMAAFMLPALMKLVPLVETAVGVGIGSSIASKTRRTGAAFGNQAAGAATANSSNAAVKRLSGAAADNGGSFLKGATSLAATGAGVGGALGLGLAVKTTKGAAASASQRLRSGSGGISSRLRGGETAQAGGGSTPGAPLDGGALGPGGTTTLTGDPGEPPSVHVPTAPASEPELAGRQAGAVSDPGGPPTGTEAATRPPQQQAMFDASAAGGGSPTAHPGSDPKPGVSPPTQTRGGGGTPNAPHTPGRSCTPGAAPDRPVKNTGTPRGPGPTDKVVKNTPPVTPPPPRGRTSGPSAPEK